jgi:ABC-2 type transport system ATP-binding protein
VLLTTHYLDEADHLAGRIAIVDHGRVVVEGTPDELKSGLRGDAVDVGLASADHADRARAALTGLGLRDVVTEGNRLRARTDDAARAVPAVLAALDDAGTPAASVTVARPSLDDVYLQHVGHSMEVAA